MIPTSDFKQPLLTLMAELFGVGAAPEGFILDSGKDGLIGTIAELSAETASAAPQSGEASIAAHCGHVLFLLQFFAAHERGETPDADWPGSWRTQTVDAAAWDALRHEIQTTYDDVMARLRAREEWPADGVGAAMMTMAHCAYHVGEIRQRRLWVTR